MRRTTKISPSDCDQPIALWVGGRTMGHRGQRRWERWRWASRWERENWTRLTGDVDAWRQLRGGDEHYGGNGRTGRGWLVMSKCGGSWEVAMSITVGTGELDEVDWWYPSTAAAERWWWTSQWERENWTRLTGDVQAWRQLRGGDKHHGGNGRIGRGWLVMSKRGGSWEVAISITVGTGELDEVDWWCPSVVAAMFAARRISHITITLMRSTDSGRIRNTAALKVDMLLGWTSLKVVKRMVWMISGNSVRPTTAFFALPGVQYTAACVHAKDT